MLIMLSGPCRWTNGEIWLQCSLDAFNQVSSFEASRSSMIGGHQDPEAANALGHSRGCAVEWGDRLSGCGDEVVGGDLVPVGRVLHSALSQLSCKASWPLGKGKVHFRAGSIGWPRCSRERALHAWAQIILFAVHQLLTGFKNTPSENQSK